MVLQTGPFAKQNYWAIVKFLKIGKSYKKHNFLTNKCQPES